MALSLNHIHCLEVDEDFRGAIKALEERLMEFPEDPETVIRLGFILWLTASNFGRIDIPENFERECGSRFVSLYDKYESKLSENADFCWAFGLGMSLFGECLPGASGELGEFLLAKAKTLDPFWKNLLGESERKLGEDEIRKKLQGRGALASYYGVE
jgi:hypothetical protein